MSDGIEVTVVMPCLSEEATLGICIRKAHLCFKQLGIRGEVVVADNGSTDRSVSIAEALGARVVVETTPGYGAALRKGIEAARGEIIIMGDSDDSYDWLDLSAYIQRIREGYDLVVGDRFAGGIQPGAMPPLHRYLGNPVLSFVARFFYRARVHDFHCGMRAFTASAYRLMKLRTTGMEFATEMIANAAIQDLKISEVPTRLYPDGRNRRPHLRSFRDGWRHLKFIFTYAPDYLYLVPGCAMLFSGIALLILLARGPFRGAGLYLGIHFLALGCMLVLSGSSIVTFGIIAKLIISQNLTNMKSRLVSWTVRRFTLERGLVGGGLLALLGLLADIWLLFDWLKSGGGPMESTKHLAFVATCLFSVGLNAMLSSFLVNMLLTNRCEKVFHAAERAESVPAGQA